MTDSNLVDFAVVGSYEYRVWYGSPRIQNPVLVFAEPRFQHRAVDDLSLRALNARVNVAVRYVHYYYYYYS